MDTNSKRVLSLPLAVAHWCLILFYLCLTGLYSPRLIPQTVKVLQPTSRLQCKYNQEDRCLQGHRGLKAGLVDRRSLCLHMALTD